MLDPLLRAASAALVVMLALGACKSECKAGESDCECRKDATCDPGLACDAGVCEALSATSTGETTGSNGSTTETDPCMGACAEGQACEDGTCAWPFDCELTCTSFKSDGVCYCQTTCVGLAEIFTCFANGECVCQGGNRPNKEIMAECTSMEAAMEIYYRCHRI